MVLLLASGLIILADMGFELYLSHETVLLIIKSGGTPRLLENRRGLGWINSKTVQARVCIANLLRSLHADAKIRRHPEAHRQMSNRVDSRLSIFSHASKAYLRLNLSTYQEVMDLLLLHA